MSAPDAALTIDVLLDLLAADHAARGTSVRCPTCNAGRGHYCRAGGPNSVTPPVTHPERVRLAAQA
jgi:hypothetical protein